MAERGIVGRVLSSISPPVHDADRMTDPSKLEWLTNVPNRTLEAFAYLLVEADEYDDPWMDAYCRRMLTLLAAKEGVRADQLVEILKKPNMMEAVSLGPRPESRNTES